jgi:uncharacterized protein (TIGR02270 family)
MTDGSYVTLGEIRRFDDRIAAHLDGLSIAGDQAWRFCDELLETASAGAVFTAAVRTIEMRNKNRLGRLLSLTEALPDRRHGLISAFGWLEREHLVGIVSDLLSCEEPFSRMVGIAACSVHRVDPGPMLARLIQDVSSIARQRALRLIGEIGSHEALPVCLTALQEADRDCEFWAARSAVLLGTHSDALEFLIEIGLEPGPYRRYGFHLVLQALSVNSAHRLLQRLAEDSTQRGWLLKGSGIVGDPSYVAWLIKQMADLRDARLAGEAFSLIVGVNLGEVGLESKRPDGFESGPNDDPSNTNVETDPDEGLPWPDVVKVEKWWAANSSRFQKGTRYFMGAPVTREHCIHVLKTGHQRQRILAAHYLCLLNPGTPLFNTSAPAWRQQRLLANMA